MPSHSDSLLLGEGALAHMVEVASIGIIRRLRRGDATTIKAVVP
jgi:hypothetical protein